MGIYSRDNVDYQGMIQNMLANRQRGAEIRSNNIRNQGQIWGNTVSNLGNIASSTIRDMAAQEEAAKQQELENSWKQQQIDFQNRQLEQQKEMQLQQMALSRELAQQQKAETAEANQDENMKNWQIANARLNAAKALYDRSAGDPQAQAAYEDALFTEQYWRKKAAVKPAEAVVAPIQQPVETPIVKTNEDYMAELKTALETGDKPYTNEVQSNARAILANINDPSLKAQGEALIKSKGSTKEQRAASAAAALNNANTEFAKLNILQRRQFLKDNPQYIAVGGKLQFKKK